MKTKCPGKVKVVIHAGGFIDGLFQFWDKNGNGLKSTEANRRFIQNACNEYHNKLKAEVL